MTTERLVEMGMAIDGCRPSTRGNWESDLRHAGYSEKEIDDWFKEKHRRDEPLLVD